MSYIKGSTLSKVIDKRRPVKTPVLDTHFSETEQVDSNLVFVDIQYDAEGLAEVVSAGTKSRRAPSFTGKEESVKIPRFTEHDLVKAADVMGRRLPGTANAPDTVKRHYNNKLDAMKSRIERTKEFMAIKSLQGQVVDGGGRVLASYAVPAGVAVDFATVDPLDAFDDGTLKISRALGFGIEGAVAYCGAVAFKKLRGSDQVQALLDGPTGHTMLANGELNYVGGLKIVRIPWVYMDNAGVEQKYMPDNKIIIAPTTGIGIKIYGPVETPEGLLLAQWYVDTEVVRDPPGQKVRVETSLLPVIKRPKAIYTIDVD